MILKTQAGDYNRMGAKKCAEGVTFTFQCPKETACAVLLYERKSKKLAARVVVPPQYCIGAVRSITIFPLKAERFYYCYEIDGKRVRDSYAERVIGREKWGNTERDLEHEELLSGFKKEGFDWGEDACPEIQPQDMVLYKLHIRGFSMDSRMKGRGTFAAVRKQLSYLKELGVTTIEVMPLYEFEEIIKPEEETDKEIGKETAVKLNYWGYAPSDYFSVKSSYGGGKDADWELKSLIREMHEKKMELVMEMHFLPEQNAGELAEILRYWVMEYHVDGFKLLGAALPIAEIIKDPYLSRTKIFYERFPEDLEKDAANLYVYNDDFLYPVRKMLNHLGGDMQEFTDIMKRQHSSRHFVDYIANSNTFTLADVFSYNEKHNGDNGEENLDGNNWNYSSNYGVEGPTRRQFVKKIREKQMRNAMAVLCLARGIPLIWSGDEIGNSQNGNNNAYCQDNRIGWVNWKNGSRYLEYTEFVRRLLAFRREHPVLSGTPCSKTGDCQKNEYPDLSYHGAEAWIGKPRSNSRAVGMMYCETYAKEEEKEDTFLYIGYNFYMGVQVFALPKLPKGKQWYQIMDTAETQPFLETPRLLKKNSYEAFGQTISILIGR